MKYLALLAVFLALPLCAQTFVPLPNGHVVEMLPSDTTISFQPHHQAVITITPRAVDTLTGVTGKYPQWNKVFWVDDSAEVESLKAKAVAGDTVPPFNKVPHTDWHRAK